MYGSPLRVTCLLDGSGEPIATAASTLSWVLRRYDEVEVVFRTKEAYPSGEVVVTVGAEDNLPKLSSGYVRIKRTDVSERRNVVVQPVSSSHPIWEGIGAFQVVDALPTERHVPAEAEVVARSAEDVPLAWVTTRNGQRMFTTLLGQTDFCWQHPWFQKMIVNAVYWCARRQPPRSQRVRAPKGFVALFNGVDLEGWGEVGTPCWSVRDGVIQCSGAGAGGWLRTNRMYGDFVLTLEYRISPGGNSGIFLRAPHFGRSSRLGIELQILDDRGQPPTPTSTAAIYNAVAPRVNPSKPAGEWNSVHLTFRGRHLRVLWNGLLVHDLFLDASDVNAPLPRTHLLTRRPSHGYIGLQHHRSLVEFRRLFIREL